ncbi:MAG: hemolysin family protein [Candidatus Zixiibacteriota bacterium]
MDRIYFEILAIIFLIAANGFFSLSEFAIIASRKSRLKRLVKMGKKSAARALKIHAQPEAFLATVQVGITFVVMLSGVFSGATLVDYLSPTIKDISIPIISEYSKLISSLIIATAISFLSIIFGELAPKYIALSAPAKIASMTSGPIYLFLKIGFIPVKILTATARAIIALLGIKHGIKPASISEEEINILIDEGREKGVFEKDEALMINSVFDFTDTTARQAMTPRTDIYGIEVKSNTEGILNVVTSHGWSRYPVYEETLDNIVGIIYTKDIIKVLQHSGQIILNDIIHKPYFVPDSMKLGVLLQTIKQKRVHIAIVLDEFGGTAGLITLEDLLEEIVGDIQDEFDTGQKEFVGKSKTLAFIAATLRPDELNDQFDTNLPENGPETIGGLIFETLGRPAQKGDEIIIGNLKFVVLEVDGNRLQRLKVEKLGKSQNSV